MKIEIIEIYKRLISNFRNEKLKGKSNAILFFQGFSSDFYKALTESDIAQFSEVPVVQATGYIDYNLIEANKMLLTFINSKGICWGYYEELLSITEVLNDLKMYSGEIIVVHNNLYSVYFPIDVPIEMSKAAQLFENDFPVNDDKELIRYYSDFKVIDRIGFFSYVNKHYEIDTNVIITETDFFNTAQQDTFSSATSSEELINIKELDTIKNKLQCGKLSDRTYCIQSLNEQPTKEIGILNELGRYFNVVFKSINISRNVDAEKASKYLELFKKYWGNSAEFRTIPIYNEPAMSTETVEVSQGVLISNIVSQCEEALSGNHYSDVIVTAPTGAGKSLFFQVPAIYLHNTKHKALTLVITPLIALMNDQINEIRGRGIGFATYINSEISYEERQERLEGIIEGKYSIVYLSPELLLSTDIKNIIGDRKIGLVVVDEAHLVTSWGRDFRVDYWFLGDHLEKIRRGSYYRKHSDSLNFPILCLTATAVFGGRDDVVGDLQNSLHLNCSEEHLYIGYVRRNNISFTINKNKIKAQDSKKEQKVFVTCLRIREFLDNDQKTIVYFPYVSQIEDVYGEISDKFPKQIKDVEKYSGGMDKFEKNEAYNNFRESPMSVMLATKAFGMGVNIPDVSVVYHFAPTGTLADYVQEIGRAARKLDFGNAIIDYLPNDMHYAKVLWGLSGLRHYQIKAIMKKLYDLYLSKKSRNLLFSPDVFSYLFDANSIDNKVKSGLMLLSSDLLEKYHFRVLNVRPKNIFSIHYINVPDEVESEFMNEYGKYCERMNDDEPRITPGYGRVAELTTYNGGKIYEIDLSKIWENEFDDLTFANFKYHFFTGDLFSFGNDKIVPRIKLLIHYEKSYDYAKEELIKIITAVQKTFNYIHRIYGGRNFTFDEFRATFNDNYDKKVRREYVAILLDLFSYEGVYFMEIPTEQWKFIEKSRNADGNTEFTENKYCIRTNKHSFIDQNVKRYLVQCFPNSVNEKDFTAYLPIPKKNGKYSEYQLVASLLELFNLATYELIGGKNSQIFVRINDPMKLKRLAESEKEYKNSLLTIIEERHKRAAKIVDRFLTVDMTDSQRWSLIENYFLGYDGIVDSQLRIED